MNVNANDLEFNKSEFQIIFSELDQLNTDPQASPTFDGMSGAFKFADEFPKHLINDENPPESLLLPCIGLLRSLWGYSQSLILGTPRSELEKIWNETIKYAPNWPGFQPKRCSPKMRETALRCVTESKYFSTALDDLNERISQRSRKQRKS
ncbi:hypothetical protein [Gimesia sp.]|uniref:hypothetical protein n=1 Tax=Gimesia sp. TaxID=2024833 RepID=UPI0025BFC3BB|nr:hypothetical protein [Gimesia sp.]|tara:strand:+ start:188 stop:640 length:453 start_codon:yes stop_codon:yes gene_type:complete